MCAGVLLFISALPVMAAGDVDTAHTDLSFPELPAYGDYIQHDEVAPVTRLELLSSPVTVGEDGTVECPVTVTEAGSYHVALVYAADAGRSLYGVLGHRPYQSEWSGDRCPNNLLPRGERLAVLHIHNNDGQWDLHILPMTRKMDYYEIFTVLHDIEYQVHFTYIKSLAFSADCRKPPARRRPL